MDIRPATIPDLAECQAIYAHHVLEGTGSFEEVPPSLETITVRYHRIVDAGRSWLIAADATGLLGFAYFDQYRPRSAYRYTAEDSVYVREDVRGQGVGKALVGRLLADARGRGFRQMLAVIGDSDNIGSIGVHASLGFQRVGTMRNVGFKFGRWLDVIIMQRSLHDDDH
ncbi:MAG: GNAT family N-acetyltransferase [Acidiphilium sp.]|nr:GNAT family N-acetyltransferase [Acidiphilium sp.]MDD4934305.1 GNAT family N-acetyltransferase [Acidiphilium sp.]